MFEKGRVMTQNGSIFFKGLRWLGMAGNGMKIDKKWLDMDGIPKPSAEFCSYRCHLSRSCKTAFLIRGTAMNWPKVPIKAHLVTFDVSREILKKYVWH